MVVDTYLFDFDGTLVDTAIYGMMYEAIIERLKQKGKIVNVDSAAQALGISKGKHGRYDSGDLCKALGMVDDYYDVLSEHIKVIPVLHEDARFVLKELKKRGKVVGVVSNSMQRTIRLYLDKYGISQYVDFIYSAGDAGCKKSSLEFWKRLIAVRKLDPVRCVMVGDTKIDDGEVPAKFGFKTFLLEDKQSLKKVLAIT